jgi:hypothetical protein
MDKPQEYSPPAAAARHNQAEHTMWLGLVKRMHVTQAICLVLNAIMPLMLPLYLLLEPNGTRLMFGMDQTKVR